MVHFITSYRGASFRVVTRLSFFQIKFCPSGQSYQSKVSSIVKLKSKRKMSEIISNENKLSMLINDTMEAMAEVSACKTKANCISLDAGPLQRV